MPCAHCSVHAYPFLKGYVRVQSLMRVAGMALRDNLARLGPKVLPVLEQAKYVANLGVRQLLKMELPAYVPDFNRAFDHLCIHTGALHLRSTKIDSFWPRQQSSTHHVLA